MQRDVRFGVSGEYLLLRGFSPKIKICRSIVQVRSGQFVTKNWSGNVEGEVAEWLKAHAWKACMR